MFEYFHHKGGRTDNGSTIYFPFIPVAGLVFLGLVNLWDFSPIQHYVTENFGSNDPFFLVKRQLLWIVSGLLLMAIVWRFYVVLSKVCWLSVFMVPMLQVLTFWPDVGARMYGSHRHIQLFGSCVYANIWVVLLSVIALSAWMIGVRKAKRPWFVAGGLFIWLLIVNCLFIEQRDLPMLVLFDVMAFGMSVMQRGPKKMAVTAVSMLVLVMLTFFVIFVLNQEYRRNRVMAAYDYRIDPLGAGYQTRIALEDIESGGWMGKGLGSFKEDEDNLSTRYVLPQTVTTHMIQITGRSQGILGIALVIALWVTLVGGGQRSVKAAQNDFDSVVKFGSLLFLGGQAFFSVVRTTNILPLAPAHAIPFFSYGSAITLSSFSAIGLLMSRSQLCLSSKLPDPKVSLKLKRHYKKFKAALTTEDMLRFRQSYTIYISEIDGARDSGIGRSELTDRDVALIMTMVELAEGYYDSIWPNTFRDVDSDLVKDNGFFYRCRCCGEKLIQPEMYVRDGHIYCDAFCYRKSREIYERIGEC